MGKVIRLVVGVYGNNETSKPKRYVVTTKAKEIRCWKKLLDKYKVTLKLEVEFLSERKTQLILSIIVNELSLNQE